MRQHLALSTIKTQADSSLALPPWPLTGMSEPPPSLERLRQRHDLSLTCYCLDVRCSRN